VRGEKSLTAIDRDLAEVLGVSEGTKEDKGSWRLFLGSRGSPATTDDPKTRSQSAPRSSSEERRQNEP
jgi:hypothetical protein